MTNEQIAELADKIQAECINWPDRFFDYDEAERLIRSALAAPAPEEEKRPCGKYIGDNNGTCPQLTCVRQRGHAGPCDNVCGDPAPPAGEDVPNPEMCCSVIGCTRPAAGVKQGVNGYASLCHGHWDCAVVFPTPASAPEKCDGKGRLPGTPGFNGRVYTVCPGCVACARVAEDAP